VREGGKREFVANKFVTAESGDIWCPVHSRAQLPVGVVSNAFLSQKVPRWPGDGPGSPG
jgi:hypothetical protein